MGNRERAIVGNMERALRGVLTVVLMHVVAALGSPAAVILDVDASSFFQYGLDVDDDLAVIFATAQSQKIEIIGVTTTFGNAPLEITHPNTLKLRALLGKQWPVLRGATFSDSTSGNRSSPASQFIASTVMERPHGSVTVIMLGAATNLAAAVQAEPLIASRLAQVVIMAGANLIDQSDSNLLELNALADPSALQQILASEASKLILPMERCCQVASTQARFENLAAACCPTAAVCALAPRVLQHTAGTHLSYPALLPDECSPNLRQGNAFVLWDVLAVAAVSHPELFGPTTTIRVSVSGLATHVSAMGEWVQLIGKPMEQELLDVIEKSWCAVPAARGLSSGGHTEASAWNSEFGFTSAPMAVIVHWMLGIVLLMANGAAKLPASGCMGFIRSWLVWLATSWAVMIREFPLPTTIAFGLVFLAPYVLVSVAIGRVGLRWMRRTFGKVKQS